MGSLRQHRDVRFWPGQRLSIETTPPTVAS